METVVVGVVRAVEEINRVGATNEERQGALEYLEGMKVNTAPGHLVELAKCIIQAYPLIPHVIHFALQLVEHLIKLHWNTVDHTVKANVINLIAMTINSNPAATCILSVAYIKAKIAQLYTEVLKREYPQHWPDALSMLYQFTSLGDPQTEIVFIVLRSIAEDVKTHSDSSTISDERRREIEVGITASFVQIIELLVSYCESQYVALGVNQSDHNKHEHMLKLVLTVFEHYVDWSPVQMLLEKRVPWTICKALSIPKSRKRAADCLIAMVVNSKAEDKQSLGFIFEFIESIEGSLALSSGDLMDDYVYLKKIVELLAPLTSVMISMPATSRTNNPKIEGYVKLLFKCFGHPSTLITSMLLPSWIVVLNSRILVEESYYVTLLTELVQVLEKKLYKDTGRDQNAAKEYTQFVHFIGLDFDSTTDFLVHFSAYRNKLKELTSVLALLNNSLIVQFILFRMSQVCSSGIDDKGYKELDNIVTFAEWSFSSFENLEVSNDILNYSNQLFNLVNHTLSQSLLETNNESHSRLLDAESALIILYKASPSSLQLLLETMFKIISFPGSQSNLPPWVIAIRRKACCTLIHVASKISPSMKDYLPQIAQTVDTLTRSGLLLDSERVHLLEVICLLIGGSDKSAQPALLKELVLTNLESSWLSSDVQTALGKMDLLATALFAGNEQSYLLPKQVLFIVQAEYVACRLLPSLIPREHLAALLPFFTKIIAFVHSLWTPQYQAAVPNELKEAFELDETSVAPLLGKANVKGAHVASDAKFVRLWMSTIRESCYNLIGLSCSWEDKPFYLHNDLATNLANITSNSKFMEMRHLKQLVKLLLYPLAVNTPENCAGVIYNTVLLPLFQVLLEKLSEGWRKVSSCESPAQTFSRFNVETQEIIADKFLRDCSREVLSFVTALIQKSSSYSVIGLHFSVAAISWPDSQSVKKAISLSLLATNTILSLDETTTPLLLQLVMVVLTALMRSYLKEFQTPLLSVFHLLFSKLKFQAALKTLLSSLPSMAPNNLDTFYSTMQKYEKDDKKQKETVKQFLSPYLGTSQGTKVAKLSNLPKHKLTESSWEGLNVDLTTLWGNE